MGPDPVPPADFAERPLAIRDVDQTWYRGHKTKYRPIHFNAGAGRFGPTDFTSFGVMYLGADPYCSFIETFAESMQDDRYGASLAEIALEPVCICEVATSRSLRVVDLTTGASLKRLAPNADARISDGSHELSRLWADAIWAHPTQPDGIYYRCRRAPDRFSLALFDRVEPVLRAPSSNNLLRDPQLLGALLEEFNCALLP